MTRGSRSPIPAAAHTLERPLLRPPGPTSWILEWRGWAWGRGELWPAVRWAWTPKDQMGPWGPPWPVGELSLALSAPRRCALRPVARPPLPPPPCALPSPLLSRSGQRASLVVPSRFPRWSGRVPLSPYPFATLFSLIWRWADADIRMLPFSDNPKHWPQGAASGGSTAVPHRRGQGSSCGHMPYPLTVSRLTELPPLWPPCSDFGFFQAPWEWRLGLPLSPLPEPPALSGSFTPDEVLRRAGTASASIDKQCSKSPSLEAEKSGFPRGALPAGLGGELSSSFQTVGPHPTSRVSGDE